METTIRKTILQIARIRQYLMPTQGLELVNSIIDVSTVHYDLMKFQKKYCPADKPGTVGSGYWRGFRKRNRRLVVSKQGQKYELDRSAWNTYANFSQMHDQVI